MKKILVIFHSQHYGDTKILAEAFAEGARDLGADVTLVNTNDRRITMEEFQAADGVAIGSPDYYSYVAGTIKTFFDDLWLWDRAGKSVKGKPAAVLFSHGTGGRARESLEFFVGRFFNQVGEMIDVQRPIDEETQKACRALGKELVDALI